MKAKLRKLLAVLLGLGAVVGIIGWIQSDLEKQEGREIYADAADLSGDVQTEAMLQTAPEEEADPVALELGQMDLAALQEVNEDVVGWIAIPNTELSYPIVQGEDNDFYLDWTWNRERNSVGAIFLECQVSPDFDDFNTIVYGHRMRDGSMFGSLKHYRESAYWQEHPSVYIATDTFVRRYDIFAAHEAESKAITFGLGISSPTKKQEFIDFSLQQSVIDTGVVPLTSDRILTLSTCTGRDYSTRWVVQAVLSLEIPGK